MASLTDTGPNGAASLDERWARVVERLLLDTHGRQVAERVATALLPRLPLHYPPHTSPSVAALDLAELDRLAAAQGSDVAMVLRAQDGRAGWPLRFVLYRRGPAITLSAFLPILESLGLTVADEVLHRLEGSTPQDPLHIQEFGVQTDAEVDLDRDAARLAEAALALWHGRAEVDALNALVLRAGLAWDEVALLRAYRRYRRQVGTAFSEAYLDAALVEQPAVARALVALFEARLNPSRPEDAQEVAEARRRVLAGIAAVERLDTDRILRGYLGLVEATVRTNRWVTDAAGRRREHLALKFDSAAVPDVPRPVPFRELFVSTPRMEGVHLRGGPVARGGVRWSDRLEDYRTEVLGLMKGQMVKNAVIVPTGAKGGFVLKRAPRDPDALRAEVRRQYEVFVRGLLDVTDNVVNGQVVPPPHVRRVDGDDPYLVVAADKGTATFSDLANAVSAEYGFWLGDAFASGGSRGYDHKAMGITARGAWVAAQRHFRELGVDVQAQPITVVGIGDMSGDVFGNGLLRSYRVKLVAAFDHRHVFLDPDPDLAAAFAERRRLFDLPRSSWDDYDRGRISAGGGVWPRHAKQIPLSPQVRALLRLDAEALTPPELIRAILRAPVDLLYAGGIGTFVKATQERDADVGDRANDAVRIDADALGARVVVEGGNLAVTQRGRVQYARRGGRINADFIDNAAGVDTSDHEVNLKILLALAEADGNLSPQARDALLAEVADDIAAEVLRDVALQTALLSRELTHGPGRIEAYEALLSRLEADPTAMRLSRDVEALPTSEELSRRTRAGAGLARPELAVLLAHAKVDLADQLTRADLPGTGAATWRAVLCGYYPPRIAERYCALLHDPRLRADLVRALVATVVANDVVNRMGITYADRTARELGATPAEVAAAYWTARQVAGAEALWTAIDALDGQVDPQVQHELHADVNLLVDALTRSYLRGDPADIDAALAEDRRAFLALQALPPARGQRRPPGGAPAATATTPRALTPTWPNGSSRSRTWP